MADEEVKPVEEVTEQKTETQEELPLAAAAEEKTETVAAAEGDKPEPVKEEPKQDWRDKELKAKYRKQKELERILAEKETEIAARDALLAKFNQGKTEETKPPVDELVERRVQQELAQRQYQNDLNKTDAKGRETYKDWQETVSTLEVLGGFDPETMSGLLATDDPAKVIYELGKNPDRYQQIMTLPVPRRIIEMGKLAMASTTSKPVSSAPAPVNPVGGRAAPANQTVTDEMDDDKWYAIRTAQKRKRWEERNGIRR